MNNKPVSSIENNRQAPIELMKSLSRRRLIGQIFSELGQRGRLALLPHVTSHLDHPSPDTRKVLAQNIVEVFLTPVLSKEGVLFIWDLLNAKVPEDEKRLVFAEIEKYSKP